MGLHKKVSITSLVQITDDGQNDIGSYLANLVLTRIINNTKY